MLEMYAKDINIVAEPCSENYKNIHCVLLITKSFTSKL